MVLLAGLLPGSVRAQTFRVPLSAENVVSVRPQVRIPVAALGYLPPGELPAFHYYSLAALDFMDSDHLLFSFNGAGLMKRSDDCDPDADDTNHKVRAVVLNLLSGSVAKQTEWVLSDYAPYLWPLQNGQFLFRRCSQISRVDAHLEPHPYIHTEGLFELLGLSPDRSLLLLESKHEPKGTTTAKLSEIQSSQSSAKLRDIDLDFIRLHPLGVVAVSHIQGVANIPLLQAGFLEVVGRSPNKWQVNLQPYHGELRVVGQLDSTCIPQIEALTDSTFLAIVCYGRDTTFYKAYDLHGHRLWQELVAQESIAPQFSHTVDESRIAIATLHTTHAVAALDPLSAEDVDGQQITVYNTRTGKHVLRVMTTPVYTAGQNFALSPNGDRLAVLHDGAIEIYSLSLLR